MKLGIWHDIEVKLHSQSLDQIDMVWGGRESMAIPGRGIYESVTNKRGLALQFCPRIARCMTMTLS